MFIDSLVNADALPTLEKAAQFAGRRQAVIAHNIANISTPRFQQRDVSIADFRAELASAVDERRRRFGGQRGELPLRSTSEVAVVQGRAGQSRLELRPGTPSGNVLFHDRNDRDLERLMQDLAENSATFRVATELFKSRLGLLQQAISERV
jgi:flagellar basal-body rod protein FlgB